MRRRLDCCVVTTDYSRVDPAEGKTESRRLGSYMKIYVPFEKGFAPNSSRQEATRK